MTKDVTSTKNPWDDDWVEDDFGQSEFEIGMECDAALERHHANVCAKLDALIQENEAFIRYYGEKVSIDMTDCLDAHLFCQLEDRMLEIGRQALMYCYPDCDLDRRTVPLPRTHDEAIKVLRRAIALYEQGSDETKAPGPETERLRDIVS